MKLENFRELLLKKSADPALGNMIKFVRDDVLADIIVESLEKMARAKHKGDAANFALRDFGLEMDPEHEPKMIHDALSHHASQYKSALKNDRKDLANEHAKQLFQIMDMADQVQKHSTGKLDIQAVAPHPWERVGKQERLTEEDAPVRRGNKKAGQFRTDTKGWRYRGKDYDFLQGEPHDSYSNETEKHGHQGAYPIEHIRVNGKYLDIKDVPADKLNGFEKHPFDHHPIMDHYGKPASKRTADDDKAYMSAKEAHADSHHMENYFDKHEKMEEADPEGYASKGSKVSDPVHGLVTPSAKPKEASVAVSEPAPKVDDKSKIAEAKLPADVIRRLKGDSSE